MHRCPWSIRIAPVKTPYFRAFLYRAAHVLFISKGCTFDADVRPIKKPLTLLSGPSGDRQTGDFEPMAFLSLVQLAPCNDAENFKELYMLNITLFMVIVKFILL